MCAACFGVRHYIGAPHRVTYPYEPAPVQWYPSKVETAHGDERLVFYCRTTSASTLHLAHPEGCAALRMVLVTVPRVSRSCAPRASAGTFLRCIYRVSQLFPTCHAWCAVQIRRIWSGKEVSPDRLGQKSTFFFAQVGKNLQDHAILIVSNLSRKPQAASQTNVNPNPF